MSDQDDTEALRELVKKLTAENEKLKLQCAEKDEAIKLLAGEVDILRAAIKPTKLVPR